MSITIRTREDAVPTGSVDAAAVPVRRLQLGVGRLLGRPATQDLLPHVLDGALTAAGTDRGCLHLIDLDGGQLRLVAVTGIEQDLAEWFTVADDRTVFARAVRAARPLHVDALEMGVPGAREVVGSAGIRDVVATPLVDHTGRVHGVVSAFFAAPRPCGTADLDLLGLYAQLAGEQVRRLGDTDERTPSVGAGSPRTPAARSADGHTGPRPSALADIRAEVADTIAADLFAIALRLDGARSLLLDSPAVDRLTALSADIDAVISRFRDLVVEQRPRGD